eukprot:comp21174_c0_seq1/m.28704 comp21174_c0_seq1/g.28704  ORF comp21174_c0_seq1/g.28704 comp21174_c0_seq1/m.28704 type:complete len:622 (-) comp21174_c0_seq1:399-2264(-)
MEYYMRQALFQLTLSAMGSPDEDVAMQAIEFWSNVADEELSMLVEGGEGASNPCMYFAKQALHALCPALLQLMTKQEDTDDDDIWNPATAAAVCLGLLANVCEGDVVPHVMPFITQNIMNPDWHYREAAVLAFGSIVDGPTANDFGAICREAIPVLAQLLNDPSVHVKDSAAYALGRVCEFQSGAVLQPDMLTPVVQALGSQIGDVPRVAVNICWAFNNLAAAAYDAEREKSNDGVVQTYPLSPMFESIVGKLVETTNRPDANMSNLRYAAYEALNQIITNSPEDCYPVVLTATQYFVNTLTNALQMQSNGAQGDKLTHLELQSLLCMALQASIQRLHKAEVTALAQPVMAMLVYMLQVAQGQAGVQEDALLAINAIVNALEADFAPYMEGLMNPLATCLSSSAEIAVCTNAIGVVSDLARNMQLKFAPFCQPIMELLGRCLQDPATDKHVKAAILSAIGDIATGMGVQFSAYVPYILPIMEQAAQAAKNINVAEADYDLQDYMITLRENILEGFCGIVIGLKGESRPWNQEMQQLKSHVPMIVEFIQVCVTDQSCTDGMMRSATGLLGDLCEVFTVQMKPLVDLAWVRRLLNEAKASDVQATKKTAQWATKVIKEYANVQ